MKQDTYEDIYILAYVAARVCFDDAFNRGAGVEFLSLRHCDGRV